MYGRRAQVEDPDILNLHTDSALKLQQVPLALSDGATLLRCALYKVLDRAPKYVHVHEVKGNQDTVSVDRWKPVHLDSANDIIRAARHSRPAT